MGIVKWRTSYDAQSKTWRGCETIKQLGKDQSLGNLILEKLLERPKYVAQVCYHNGKSLTNEEIATLSKSVARHFQSNNFSVALQQGDVVGLCAGNTDFVAPLFFGAVLRGLTVSTLDPSFDKDGIKHIFAITKPKVMFCDGANYETVREALREIGSKATIFTMANHRPGVRQIMEFLDEPTEDFQPVELENGPSQLAAILCSSGTTGLPKGVCVSHAALMNLNCNFLTPGDIMLCFSTLYWISGVYTLVRGTINGVTRIISQTGFSPDACFDIIEKYKVTILLTPPSQMALCVFSPKISKSNLSSIRYYLCGGSAVPYALVKKVKPYMKNASFIVGYGMTEIANMASMDVAQGNNTVGQLCDNIQIMVVDKNGNRLGPDENGEICIKTQFSWSGYYGNEEATRLIHEAESGWIHTGDVGYINKEGNLFIVDRLKDILKYNNFHFSPSEIESVINELTDIAEVCVFGIPDVVSTFLPAAAIVKTPDSTLTESEVIQWVAKRMAHFKHLHGGVYFLEELPKTASGKNLRWNIAKICEDKRTTLSDVQL